MMHKYRTTFTPTPPVAKAIRDRAKREGKSISQVVDELLQAALGIRKPPKKQCKRFVVKARNLHLRPGLDPLKLKEILTAIEVEAIDHS